MYAVFYMILHNVYLPYSRKGEVFSQVIQDFSDNFQIIGQNFVETDGKRRGALADISQPIAPAPSVRACSLGLLLTRVALF